METVIIVSSHENTESLWYRHQFLELGEKKAGFS